LGSNYYNNYYIDCELIYYMILDEIVKSTKEILCLRKTTKTLPALREIAEKMGKPQRISFCTALRASSKVSKKSQISLIAEIKKASPSKGLIRADFDPVGIALEYEKAKVSAISVLTEEKYFLGSIDYLKLVREKVSTPILRKDFIVDPYQIYEAKAAGADAILLIASILSKDELTDYINLAKSLYLDSLVEIHTLEEMEKVLETPAKIIGINNRDLKTFNVDIGTTIDIASKLPEGIVKVSESGVFSRKDVEKLEESGVDAVLVGESLMRSKNIGAKVVELLGNDNCGNT